MRILRNGPVRLPSTHRRGTMSRKIPLVAALVAAALVIPTTAAQAADSGLTPTVSPFTYGDITAGQGYYNWADPIVLTNTTGSDVTLSAGVDTVTSSNDGWGWIGVGGSPYPSCISQSLVVAPGDSCSFVPYVVWQGVLGDTTATLTVHSDQGTTDIPVSANFQASIADYLPKGYFWFPQVVGPAPKTHTFYVKNDGNIDLNTTSVTLFDGQPLEPSFHIVSDGCSGAPVTPGATCPITVSFDGPSDWKVGTELVVTTDATPGVGTGSGPTLQFDMTGVRIRLAVLSHALSAHRFIPVDANGNRHSVSYTFKTTTPAHDTLQIVNSHGHVVKSWTFRYIKRLGSPSRSVTWHGHSNSGRLVKRGTYHFRVRLNEYGTTHYGGRARITVD
jgi:hypothetical protein